MLSLDAINQEKIEREFRAKRKVKHMTNEKSTRFTSVKAKGGASSGKSAKIQVTVVNFKGKKIRIVG